MKAHITTFRQFLLSHPSYHLFGIAESRLGPSIGDDLVEIEGYSIIRQDRNTHGGGVLLYVSNLWKAKILCTSATMVDDRKPGVPEYIMCSIQQGSSPPVFVAVIYRPPDAELINSDLAEALEQHSVGFAHRIVMGDLNANMLVTEQESTFVKHLACQLNLKLVEHGATNHQNGKSHTWIDVIFTDDDDVVLDSNNMTATYRNSHNIIDVIIDLPVSQNPPLGRFTYRNFKAIRQEQLLSYLNDCDWSTVNCADDVDTRLECLNANITNALDELAPIKEFRPNRKQLPPWVGAELRELYANRDALRRRYQRTRNHDHWEECQSLALLAEQRSREARDTFLQNKIFEALDSGKDIWKELRSLGLLPQNRAREELHGFSPKELNTHFAGVSVSAEEHEENMNEVMATASEEGFTFSKVTFSDVVLAVAHFSSQAKGEDGIPQGVIAKALPVIGYHLADIFNASLLKGIFPNSWKKAHLVPLKKTAIPSTVTDFRPVALLSFLSKVLEKLVHDQISAFLASKKFSILFNLDLDQVTVCRQLC